MKTQESKAVAGWLFVLAGLVFLMTVLGGVTRLTGSGLSMVQWAPIMGWFPPMGQSEWESAFSIYQTSPEFQEVNAHMDLEGFKGIFWLEFLHRLLGRVIGVTFLLPFFYFLAKGQLVRSHVPRVIGMFVLGGAQGVMGWYMVKSGLVDVPHVSHYRLAAHLGLAFVIVAYILWMAMDFRISFDDAQKNRLSTPTILTLMLSVLVFVTVISGAFVAGTHAGLAYNTFPLMEGHWIPTSYWQLQPAWHNHLENIPTIQWNHRFLALLVFSSIVGFWFFIGRNASQSSLKMGANLLLAMGIIQVILGILTLLYEVPVFLASAHQAGSMILFGLVLYNLHVWWHRLDGSSVSDGTVS